MKVITLLLLVLCAFGCGKTPVSPEPAEKVKGTYEVVFSWKDTLTRTPTGEEKQILRKVYDISGDTLRAADPSNTFVLKGNEGVFPTEIHIRKNVSGAIGSFCAAHDGTGVLLIAR